MKGSCDHFCPNSAEIKSMAATKIENAEGYWIRYVQTHSFSNELLLLKQGKLMPRSSEIKVWSLFLDKDCFLRLGCRLQMLEEYNATTHPIIGFACR